MKRFISIFLWVLVAATAAAQGYGGDYNPDNPGHPDMPADPVPKPVVYPMTVKALPSYGGSVNISSGSYTAGTTVSLRATAVTGYRFVKWTESDTLVSNEASFTYTMPADTVNLTAVFVYDPSLPGNPPAVYAKHKLYVMASPLSGGTINATSPVVLEEEKSQSLTATANRNYRFLHWELNGAVYDTLQTTTYTMGSSNATLKAVFVYDPIDFLLNVSVKPVGAGSLNTTGGVYEKNTAVSVQTTPNTGFIFQHWTLNDTIVTQERNYAFNMPLTDVEMVAHYVYNPSSPANPDTAVITPPTPPVTKHTLTLQAVPAVASGFNVGNTSQVVENSDVTLSPSNIATGYRFLRWERKGIVLSATASYTYHMGTANDTLTAIFEYNPTSPDEYGTNYWNAATGELVIDDFASGQLLNTASNLVGGSGNYGLVKRFTVYGSMTATDVNAARQMTNCAVLNLRNTRGYTQINSNAYQNHPSLRQVILPAGLTQINRQAFAGCSRLSVVTCYALTPPALGEEVFSGIASGAVLRVPEESVELYRAADGWKDFFVMPAAEEGEAHLETTPVKLQRGEVKEQDVSMKTTQPVKSVSCHVYLPTYLTFEGYDDSTYVQFISRAAGATVTNELINDSHLAVTITAAEGQTLGSSDGRLFTFRSKMVNDEIPNGTYVVTLGEQVVTQQLNDSVQMELRPADRLSLIQVYEYFTITVADTLTGGHITGGGTYESGSLVTLTAVPDTLYRFDRWSNGLTENPYVFTITKSDTLSAQFVSAERTITYLVDGDTVAVQRWLPLAVITPPDLPREGYSFDGWAGLPREMPNRDFAVVGTYSLNYYDYTYMVSDTVFYQARVGYAQPVPDAPEPTKEGHTFLKWSEAKPDSMPGRNVTVEAVFKVNTYQITYMVNGTVYRRDSVDYGASIVLPEPPEEAGGFFEGWQDAPETMPAHDLVIMGSYPNSFNLSFVVDGVVTTTLRCVVGTSLDAILAEMPTPEKEGYLFSGWQNVVDVMPDHDVELTATFTILSYRLRYFVDGEAYSSDSLDYRTTIVPIAAPEKEGHTFGGWQNVPETMPAHDVDIHGEFTVNSYVLTYQVDGLTHHVDTVVYATTIQPIAPPVKVGHTFSGWQDVPETMPAHDVTISGTFTVNKYPLIYLVDGSEYHREEVVYGSAVQPISEPTKEGHTFMGWQNVPETMPAEEWTITGEFRVNTYRLVYEIDGVELSVDSVDYGTPIVPIAAPDKLGHAFDGWQNVPEMMPAHDVTISGSYTAQEYQLVYLLDGAVHHRENVVFGTSIQPITAPEKEGHTFGGWQNVPETMPAEEWTITGEFRVNTYRLVYEAEGAEVSVDSVDFGRTLEYVDFVLAPVKEYYRFDSWQNVPATMPAHDVTLTAQYSLIRPNYADDVERLVLEGYLLDEQELARIRSLKRLRLLDISGSRVMTEDRRDTLEAGALSGIATLEEVRLSRWVKEVGEGILTDCPALLLVEWNTTQPVERSTFGQTEPVLIEVPEGTSVYRTENVVVGQYCESLQLNDARGFRSHRPFLAEQARYVKTFDKQTQKERAGGWESLVLPFEVERMTGQNQDGLQLELLSFEQVKDADIEADRDFGSKYGLYWLASMENNVWTPAARIEANRPYILAVPNSEEYEEEFNISGEVTFEAEHVLVNATSAEAEAYTSVEIDGTTYDGHLPVVLRGEGVNLRPNFEPLAAADSVYALNREVYQTDFLPGSIFLKNHDSVHPFECYLTAEAAFRSNRFFRIMLDLSANAIRKVKNDATDDLLIRTEPSTIVLTAAKDQRVNIFTADGRLMRTLTLRAGEEQRCGVTPGIYLVGRKKISVIP